MKLRRRIFDMGTMRRLLEVAERQALLAGEPEFGAEYVLLAALDLPDGAAARVFAESGYTAADLRSAIDGGHEAALAQAGIESPSSLPVTPGANPTSRMAKPRGSTRDLLKATSKRAKESGGAFSSAHVILGALDLEQGTLPRALKQLWPDPEVIRQAAHQEIATQVHRPAP